MADHLSLLNRERVSVATRLARAALNELRGPYQEEFEKRAKALDLNDIDPSAAESYLEAEVERDVIVAFGAHANWLASRLWWRKLHEGAPLHPQHLPRLTATDLKRISAKTGASEEVLRWLDEHYQTDADVSIPGVGKVIRSTLTPDRNALEAWASCFTWDQGALSSDD
jgi:hypothetical protein